MSERSRGAVRRRSSLRLTFPGRILLVFSVVALLPGSRRKEITRHLPTMLAGIRELLATVPHVHPVIPVASTIPRALIDRLVARTGVRVTIVDGHCTEVLSAADAARI